MLFQTPTQFAVLALVLVAGWLFGLASHPGGRKWRSRYEAEREAHAAYRREAEARVKTSDDRVAELERRNATLESDVRAAGVAVPAAPLAADAPRRGNWLGTGEAHDLSRIRGIDGALQKRLAGAGVETFSDVERLSDTEAAALESKLSLPEGTVARDEWREQAAMLAAGREDEWRGRYG
jgi:predicted flap endonuclease-1-like 5' DNA nuclease